MSEYLDPDPFNRNWSAPTSPAPPKAYADVTVILDRSASMIAMQQGVVDGFNDQVKKIRETPGDTRWTLIQFDDLSSARGAGEEFPHVMFENKGEGEVPFLSLAPKDVREASFGYKNAIVWGIQPDPTTRSSEGFSGQDVIAYQPRGGTALIDALYSSIEKTELRTSGGEDHIKHIVMVVTDGEENQSRRYNNDDLKEKIAKKISEGWVFTYLGANQDSFAQASKMGMTNPDLSSYTYTGMSIQSGAVASGSFAHFNWSSSSGAISSGSIGIFHLVSGSIQRGVKVQ